MHRSIRLFRHVFAQASLGCLFTVSLVHAAITNCMVNSALDDPATASSVVNVTTASGTLRDCLLAANLLTGSTGRPTAAGMTITFDPSLSGAIISLSSDLPLLFNNARIDASALANPVSIDGGSAHRIFFVSGLPPIPVSGAPDPDGAQAIAVSLKHLALQNGLARGGGAGGGGGGMGAGGALFVNKFAALTLVDVTFAQNKAQGGSKSGAGIGGGGGMGNAFADLGGGGLGSASLSDGGAGLGTGGTSGGASGGWGGQVLGQISNAQGFSAASFDVDSGAGVGGSPGAAGLIGGGGRAGSDVGGIGGGNGGFGGGGGASYNGSGGNGGFGGGGGAGGCVVQGNGGFGGGGGRGAASACSPSAGGYGGFGGGGGFHAGGVGGGMVFGGGAGFGGAVFVRAGGSVRVQGSGIGTMSDGSVDGGIGSLGLNGAQAGSGMFLMYGASAIFDIAGSYAIADTLADDSAASLPGVTYTAGSSPGAPILKEGTGTLNLSGTNTYAGATTINDGILRVISPGSINASAVKIAAPGILTGNGSTGAIDSFGTLAAGTLAAPQGTLSVNGTLKLETGSLTCFHANASASVSDLNVAGAATVNGLARIDFSSGPSAGTPYILLNAASITGTFAGFETNMPNLDGDLSYSSTAVTFTVSASDALFQNGFDQTESDSPCVAAFTN